MAGCGSFEVASRNHRSAVPPRRAHVILASLAGGHDSIPTTRGSTLCEILVKSEPWPIPRDHLSRAAARIAPGRARSIGPRPRLRGPGPGTRPRGVVDRRPGPPYTAPAIHRRHDNGVLNFEAHFPAQYASAQAPPRVPLAHGDGRWPSGARAPSRQGAQAPVRLSRCPRFSR